MFEDIFKKIKEFKISPDDYVKIIRLVSIVVSIALWWMSVQFSRDGFRFSVNIPNAGIYGTILALSVTAIQIVWNRIGSANLTIAVIGISAYTYGIYTNIMGIAEAQQLANGTGLFMVGGLDVNLFTLISALFLEITPEVLLVYGLTSQTNLGDPLGNLFKSQGKNKGVSGKSKPSNSEQDKGGQHSQNRNSGNSHRSNRPLL